MEKNLQQKRLTLLFPLLMVILLASWFLAARKTWNSYRQLKFANSELAVSETYATRLQELERELNEIRSFQDVRSDSLQHELTFKRISDLSLSVGSTKIIQFPEIHRYILDEHQVETLKVEMEGDYKNLLTFLHRLEQERTTGKIVSAGFKVIKDFRQNKESLRLTVFIQNFHKNTSL